MYLSYCEYVSMGGTLDDFTFADLELEAESVVNHYTFNRLARESHVSEKVKRLMFRLIGLCAVKQSFLKLGSDGTVQGSITMQSNDGVATTYNVLSASQVTDTADTTTANLVRYYLQGEKNSLGQNLLYRGIYPNE